MPSEDIIAAQYSWRKQNRRYNVGSRENTWIRIPKLAKFRLQALNAKHPANVIIPEQSLINYAQSTRFSMHAALTKDLSDSLAFHEL